MQQVFDKSHTVVLLHGIGRSAWCMVWLKWWLGWFGFDVLNISYPSKKLDLNGCADFLHSKIKNYSMQSISIVAHSMGGIVVRKYIEKYGEEKFRRIVMLGTPNQGSYIAYKLRKILYYIYGPAALELGDFEKIQALPTPRCEFAIIAGHTGFPFGFNPFLPGDNDFLVSIDETELQGAKQILKVHHLHAFLMNGRDSIQFIRNFLLTGKG